MKKVWIKIDDTPPGKVTVDDGADVDDLKKAIKEELAGELKDIHHRLLKVFAAGANPSTSAPLDEGAIVPSNTKSMSPLIVVTPQQQTQQEIWIKLGDTPPGTVEVDDVADVDDLKKAIKKEWANQLHRCDAAALRVYSPETTSFHQENSIRPNKTLKELIDELGNNNPPVSIDYDHPLIVVASAAATLDDLIFEVRALKLNERATPNMTPASFGGQEMKRLKDANRVKVYKGDKGEGPSVLTTTQAALLGEKTNEHHVVAFLTSVLEDVLKKDGYSIVNSEEYPWLRTSKEAKYNQKPDLLFCHDSIYTKKGAPATRDQELKAMRREAYKFGILSDWRLRNCIGVTFEAKIKNTHLGFGEVANYGAHICFGDSAPVHTRLILFDTTEFWLVDCTKGTISSVTVCSWTTPGSSKLLSEFPLEDALVKLIKRACNEFNVNVQPGAFLGAGAFGFVFKVHRSGCNRPLALKLVLNESNNVTDLEGEMLLMRAACKKSPDSVMGIEGQGFASLGDLGGALLLSNVGIAVPDNRSKDLILSLSELHRHDIIHGDPRIQNAVLVMDTLYWIDFRVAKLHMNGALLKRLDMETLLQSLGVTAEKSKDYVKDYNGSEDEAMAIVSLVGA